MTLFKFEHAAHRWAFRALLLVASAGMPQALLAQTIGAEKADTKKVANNEGATDTDTSDIVVTGSRIDRAGFDAPTPTTVLNETDIKIGGRANIGAVLTDLPQFRATISPVTTAGNTNSGSVTADMRGLGVARTLTLLNGRRFIGDRDLNNVPLGVVKRVEAVTGGASAAWGSGAVAGVVNLILDDDLTGFKVGIQSGISSRSDAARYGADASFGTRFAGGRGHIMIAGDYLKDRGILHRNNGKRPYLEGAVFTTPAGQLELVRDVNFTNSYVGGVITSGVLAGQIFNSNGTLRVCLGNSIWWISLGSEV